MPPLISFETGRKHKLNLLFKTTRWSETANGSLVLLKQEPRLRGQHTRREIRKSLYPRSSQARQESFCPLDKDLSWNCGKLGMWLRPKPSQNENTPSSKKDPT